MTEEPNAAPDGGPEAPESAGDGGITAVRKEAAGYRRKLRDAEAERDGLAERLRAFQRGEAERVASVETDGFRPLNDGSDLWRGDGVELEALLDDDGNLDAAKVRQAAVEVVAEHPHWATPGPFGDLDAGKGSAVRPEPQSPFAAGLKNAAGRG